MQAAAYSLLRPDLLARIAPLVLGLAAVSAVCYYSLRILFRRTVLVRRLRGFRLGTRGTSELEFTLALPIFLVSILTVIQLTLMIDANLMVDYAAFTAARSAIVWIPHDAGAEGPGIVSESDTSVKRQRIARAALIGCLPISPRLSDIPGFFFSPGNPAPIDPATLGRYYADGVETTRPGHDISYFRLALDVLDRWPYASEYTEVELLGMGGEPATSFPTEGTVTVRVTHRFLMQVPMAGALLGAAFGGRFGYIGPYYIPISSTYTLMLAHS